jgi:hypothetical protein
MALACFWYRVDYAANRWKQHNSYTVCLDTEVWRYGVH